jgi:hypothetical protein
MGSEQEHIEELLQTCLESIASGQDTIDSVLARYPQLADDLRSALEAASWLRLRSDLLNPRPGFVMASRSRLLEQVQREQAARQRAEAERPVSRWQRLLSVFFRPRWSYQLVLGLFLLIALTVVTGSGLVAAADALPGEPLYPVKLAYEKAQLSVTQSKTGDANLHLEFAQRRLEEIQKSVETGRSQAVTTAVEDMQWQVGQAIQLLDSAAISDPAKAHEVALDLQTVLTKEKAALSDLAGKTPPQASHVLERAAQVSEQSLLAVQGILKSSPFPASATDTPTSSPTASRTPLLTLTSRPSATPVPSATSTPTPSVTATPSPTTTIAPGLLDEGKPTRRPTHTPKPTKTVKPHPTQSHKTPRP